MWKLKLTDSKLGTEIVLTYEETTLYSGEIQRSINTLIYRVIKKSLCIWWCTVIIRCTETFWSLCIVINGAIQNKSYKIKQFTNVTVYAREMKYLEQEWFETI